MYSSINKILSKYSKFHTSSQAKFITFISITQHKFIHYNFIIRWKWHPYYLVLLCLMMTLCFSRSIYALLVQLDLCHHSPHFFVSVSFDHSQSSPSSGSRSAEPYSNSPHRSLESTSCSPHKPEAILFQAVPRCPEEKWNKQFSYLPIKRYLLEFQFLLPDQI